MGLEVKPPLGDRLNAFGEVIALIGRLLLHLASTGKASGFGWGWRDLFFARPGGRHVAGEPTGLKPAAAGSGGEGVSPALASPRHQQEALKPSQAPSSRHTPVVLSRRPTQLYRPLDFELVHKKVHVVGGAERGVCTCVGLFIYGVRGVNIKSVFATTKECRNIYLVLLKQTMSIKKINTHL